MLFLTFNNVTCKLLACKSYIYIYIYIIINIIIIKSRWFLWPSFSIRPSHMLLPACLANYILCPRRAVVGKFLLVGQHWHGHKKDPKVNVTYEEWFEISRWTNRTWILHNVSNVMWHILKKRTLIHWSNGQFFLVINSQLFLLYNFSKFLYIHR